MPGTEHTRDGVLLLSVLSFLFNKTLRQLCLSSAFPGKPDVDLKPGSEGWEIQNKGARFSAGLERTRDTAGWMSLHFNCTKVLAVAMTIGQYHCYACSRAALRELRTGLTPT